MQGGEGEERYMQRSEKKQEKGNAAQGGLGLKQFKEGVWTSLTCRLSPIKGTPDRGTRKKGEGGFEGKSEFLEADKWNEKR